MTEEEWLACEEPHLLLRHLQGRKLGRKMRLHACACVRRVWPRLTDERSRAAVEAAESFADGRIDRHEIERAASRALSVVMIRGMIGAGSLDSAYAASWAASRESVKEAWRAAADAELGQAKPVVLKAQSDLLREVIGNPFKPLGPLGDVATPTPALLAQAAYDDRILPSGHLDNARLGVLSDALEEAGCTDEAILSHLRSPGPHVRGCWALDLVLGKE